MVLHANLNTDVLCVANLDMVPSIVEEEPVEDIQPTVTKQNTEMTDITITLGGTINIIMVGGKMERNNVNITIQ